MIESERTSTAGKKCPICGQWVSTDIPRISITARRGQTAADVVQREFVAHLRTYHPDYLRWVRPYQVIGVGLVISELLFVLVAPVLSIPLLLVAILVPLPLLIVLWLLYRRKLKAFKTHGAIIILGPLLHDLDEILKEFNEPKCWNHQRNPLLIEAQCFSL